MRENNSYFSDINICEIDTISSLEICIGHKPLFKEVYALVLSVLSVLSVLFLLDLLDLIFLLDLLDLLDLSNLLDLLDLSNLLDLLSLIAIEFILLFNIIAIELFGIFVLYKFSFISEKA